MPQPVEQRQNLHCTVLTLGDRGVLIRGRSGSGKTALALALLARAQSLGRNGTLVADDQALLSPSNGRLVCIAPPAIAGLVEVRGSTPQAIAHEPAAVIDLVVELTRLEHAPRYSEGNSVEIAGCAVPSLTLAERDTEGALAAIATRLSLPPFARLT